MLGLFLLTLAVVALAMLAMAVGVALSGRCLRGSCGGPEALGPDGESLSCATCPNRPGGRDATPEGHARLDPFGGT